MQKRLTKKDRFFNNIDLTVDDDVCIGIDVHKVKCHIAIWLNEAIALTFVTPSDNIEERKGVRYIFKLAAV